MHQMKFTTLLIVFLQIFISLDFANASSKLENNLMLSKLIDLENPWGMDLIAVSYTHLTLPTKRIV